MHRHNTSTDTAAKWARMLKPCANLVNAQGTWFTNYFLEIAAPKWRKFKFSVSAGIRKKKIKKVFHLKKKLLKRAFSKKVISLQLGWIYALKTSALAEAWISFHFFQFLWLSLQTLLSANLSEKCLSKYLLASFTLLNFRCSLSVGDFVVSVCRVNMIVNN